jgi:hypothetical protein
MRVLTFLAGCVSGIVLAHQWKGLTKGGIKAGIRIQHKTREAVAKLVEDVEDLAAEAREELAAEQQREGGGA